MGYWFELPDELALERAELTSELVELLAELALEREPCSELADELDLERDELAEELERDREFLDGAGEL